MNNEKKTSSRTAGVWAALAVITIITLLLAACQPAPAPITPTEEAVPTAPPPIPTQTPLPTEPPDYSAQLQSQVWALVAIGDPANPAVVEAGTIVTANFAPDGTISGSGGCNSYTGGYTLTGEQISVGPLASTMMYCEQGGQQETTYLAALQQAKRFTFPSFDRLQIIYDAGDGTEGVLVYAQGATPLVGTNWVLVAYGDPEEPATVEPGTSITAVFYEDGSLTGNAGCNSYAASYTYTVETGSLAVTPPASTLMACPMGMEQESTYLAALSQAERFTITGPRLDISYDGGSGKLTFTNLALPLQYTLWTLASFNGSPVAENVPLTMQFIPGEQPDSGTVGGLVVCNNYNASYTLDGANMALSQPVTTRMACAPETVEMETAYLAALAGIQTYQILANQLLVTSSAGQMAFVADRAPLVGTNWVLTAMGDVDNPIAPAEDADFTAFFTRQTGVPSGLLQGRSGCNQYNATFVASVTEIKIDPPATTLMACPSPIAEQESEYLQALAGASQYAIIGDVLKIPYGEGKMLSFVAMPVEAVPEVDLRPLQGTFWFLTAINGQALISGTQITAQFFVNPDAISGSVSGLAGCNNYTAGIEAGFKVGAPATTRVSCATPDGVMQQEQLYLSQLQQVTGYSLAGGQLILPTTSGTLVYSSTPPQDQPEPVEPDSLLVNRKWYLKAIEDTAAIPGSEPTAYFASDGKLSGYTGCNSYNGRFETDEDEISISNLSSSVSSCPDAQMEQEAAFLSGLSDAATFDVSDTRLRLYTADNEALFFQSTPPEPVEPDDDGDDDNVDPPVDPIPPQAVIEAPREAQVNQEVTFDGSGSQSAVEITTYHWNFADGTEVDGVQATHAFASPGDYLVALTVTDANNLDNTTTWVITILGQEEPEPPDPPSAVIIAPPTTDTLTPVIFDGSASLSDATITSYQWDMGDGTLLEGMQVEYTFPTAGTYTVTLTVTDEFGQQGTTESDITVFESAPDQSDSTLPEATPTPY